MKRNCAICKEPMTEEEIEMYEVHCENCEAEDSGYDERAPKTERAAIRQVARRLEEAAESKATIHRLLSCMVAFADEMKQRGQPELYEIVMDELEQAAPKVFPAFLQSIAAQRVKMGNDPAVNKGNLSS